MMSASLSTVITENETQDRSDTYIPYRSDAFEDVIHSTGGSYGICQIETSSEYILLMNSCESR